MAVHGARHGHPPVPGIGTARSDRFPMDRCSAATYRITLVPFASGVANGYRVDHPEGRNLPVSQARVRAGVGRIRVDIIGAAFRGPGVSIGRAAVEVEDRAAGDVVIDDSVRESVELVTLPHELAADGVYFRRRHPIGERLFVDADELRRKHERGEVDDWHVGRDAVVVCGITLRDGSASRPPCELPM